MVGVTFGGLPARGVSRSTVLVAASSYRLATLDDVKDELQVDTGASDGTLNRYLDSASAAIAQYCNRVFPVETVRDEFWPQRDSYPYQVPGGVEALQLARWPVQQVTSATENGTTLTVETDFLVDPQTGLLVRLGPDGYPCLWPTWPVVVEYEAGFVKIPAEVQDAAIRMVKSRWAARGRDPYLMSEDIAGVYSARWWIANGKDAGNFTPDIEDLVDNYRAPVVA